MPIVALDNRQWGFDTNCFVCEPSNARGLQVPFFHDVDGDLVFAEFTLSDDFSGAPTWVHGGVALAICDEAMSWATIATREKWAVTKSINATFERPLLVAKAYRLEARVTGGDDVAFTTEAEIVSADRQKRCVQSTAVLQVVTAVQAPALGLRFEGDAAKFVRDA